ncbi:hypothetical protein ScPMuIL_006006 [Solemya velum]
MESKQVLFFLAVTGLTICSVSASIEFNDYDMMAQAFCTAATEQPAYVYAVRRNCAGTTPTCNEICTGLYSSIRKDIRYSRDLVECFDAVNVAKRRPTFADNPGSIQPDEKKLGPKTYRYGSGGCTWKENHCGPNYCCCRARNEKKFHVEPE